MPEMPEVEAFKDYISDTSLNKKIIDIHTNAPSLIRNCKFNDFKKSVKGRSLRSVTRLGKYLIIGLSDTTKKMVMHFGLTGTLNYTSKNEAIKFSFLQFIFDDTALNFIDKRKFGGIWLTENLATIKSLKNLGPDPLKLSQQQFITVLDKYKRKNIKSLLMNQKVISGIGNEYSDEILFQAGIDPHHNIVDLTKNQLKKLYNSMCDVLIYASKLRKRYEKKIKGTEFFSKDDRELFKSSYLQAHRHNDNMCPKHKNHKLKTEKIAGRTSYYCPKDQK